MNRRTTAVLTALLAALLLAIAASNASAAIPRCASCSGWWHVEVDAVPTVIPAGGTATVNIAAINIGNGQIEGSSSPVSIVDTLPAGLTATAVKGAAGSSGHDQGEVVCATPPAVECTWSGPGSISTGERIEVEVEVEAEESVEAHVADGFTVSGGRLAEVRGTKQLTTSPSAATTFGVDAFSLTPESVGGEDQVQAGAHPYQLTTALTFNQTTEFNPIAERVLPTAPALAKDVSFNLPPGLIGNTTAVNQCTEQEFGNIFNDVNQCPADTAVGTVSVKVNEPNIVKVFDRVVPLFNLTPAKGEPARFGFEVVGIPVVLDTAVRTGSDYGIVVTVRNANQNAAILSSVTTVWGTPADPSHDEARGWGCVEDGRYDEISSVPACQKSTSEHATPFLALPGSCTGPFTSTANADSWRGDAVGPISSTLQDSTGTPVGIDGCDLLSFEPTLSVSPEVKTTSSPSGFDVDIHVPQESGQSAGGLVPATVKSTTVTLPAGVQVNPSGANGLVACSLNQAGFVSNAQIFTPLASACPEGAKVGTVTIDTPLLPNPLTGGLFVAAQSANPFGGLLALYLAAEDPISGVRVKLAGNVVLDETTGQISTSFEGTPQVPFEDLKVHLFGGPRAPLSTPSACGQYLSSAGFTPWSSGHAAGAVSTLSIDSAGPGQSCGAPQSFSPTVVAGTEGNGAGKFSSFSFVLARPDQSQALSKVVVHMPPGLLGTLKTVALCPEPEASQGTCGPQSLIGQVAVQAGVGSEPYAVQPGQVYLTGPYKGAPFGLTIVNEAVAGPFDLGKVVVRASVAVDLNTAALTVTSDPFPTILQGIPLDLKRVTMTISRPEGFIFNRTNCTPTAITGTVTGVLGTSTGFSEPYNAVNCTKLAFGPKLTFTATGKTSRVTGAGLKMKMSLGGAPGGKNANLAQIKVTLPRQLPSRITTLHFACAAATFNADPTKCPSQAHIGSVKALTPILPVALEGPVYIVSHGGEAFPDIVLVLHGYGITVDVTGHINIKKGITSAAFRAVPDVPVTSVEVSFPRGKFSILGAFGSLCNRPLHVPVSLEGANGLKLSRNVALGVTGCPKKPKTGKRASRSVKHP